MATLKSELFRVKLTACPCHRFLGLPVYFELGEQSLRAMKQPKESKRAKQIRIASFVTKSHQLHEVVCNIAKTALSHTFSDPIWSKPSSQQLCFTATVVYFLEHLGKGHLLSRTQSAGLLGGWLSLKFFECFDLSTMLLDQGLDGPNCFGPQDAISICSAEKNVNGCVVS